MFCFPSVQRARCAVSCPGAARYSDTAASGPAGVRAPIELSSGNLLARLGAGVSLVQVPIRRGGMLGVYLILALQ
jgi:hypothetical protein